MRKTLSIMAASTLLAVGLGNTALADEGGEKSGLFVGVHGGVSLFGVGIYDETGKKATDRELKDNFGVNASTTSFNVGLKAGYQYFFMPIVGVRGYLGYDFNGSRALMKLGMGMKDVNVSFQNITLNADVMVNFLNTDSFTLGAYVGFGLGYGITGITGQKAAIDMVLGDMNYNGFNIPINVGIAATFAGSHKVEIGAKIQALSAGYSSKTKNDKSEILMNTHVINVGYSYIF
ncbi:MAG: outer membrane beta-barrel protein [Helicobacter sp.]|uniref:outer membrane beta-barrel protein n=1 Tax=Helicobacter sp. TaxID=218 RepID=UPI002A918C8A|nr:outer membrane beta-barrel protein [Helicobacter sp.]MDY5950137.1 outer membrane beta-barrel protein [Helicobacter sp.]